MRARAGARPLAVVVGPRMVGMSPGRRNAPPSATPAADDLVAVAAELYALLPDEFTATRNERAKNARDDGDKELADRIRRLAKPSAAAWVMNLLARNLAEEIDGVVALGASLRKAQADLDRNELRKLGQLRHELIAAVARRGLALAEDLGQRISASATTEIEQTLQAAMADPDAAAAIRSGLLTKGLTSTGLDPVDLADALAVPSQGTVSEPAHGTPGRSPAQRDTASRQAERARTDARRKLEQAEQRFDRATSELDTIDQRIKKLMPRRENLAAELAELRTRIEEVEGDIAAADRDGKALLRDRERADRSASEADRDATRARERLDGLS